MFGTNILGAISILAVSSGFILVLSSKLSKSLGNECVDWKSDILRDMLGKDDELGDKPKEFKEF